MWFDSSWGVRREERRSSTALDTYASGWFENDNNPDVKRRLCPSAIQFAFLALRIIHLFARAFRWSLVLSKTWFLSPKRQMLNRPSRNSAFIALMSP